MLFDPPRLGRVKDYTMFKSRNHTLLWMKDLIEHMSRCHDQLQWTSDGATQSFLTEALMGDLNECQKLCEQLKPTSHASNRNLVTSC
jgi:hypothetical protein